MVAILGGNGGHSNSKLPTVGHLTAPGRNKEPAPGGRALVSMGVGAGAGSMIVDVASGNITLQDQDGLAISRGLDVGVTRTYNSLGRTTDTNQDTWWMNGYRQISNLNGKANKPHSSVQRVGEDGLATTYHYDTASKSYHPAPGSGSFDTLTYNEKAKEWTWTEADTQNVEVYSASGSEWRLAAATDQNGNTSTYAYTGKLLTSITDASGERVEFSYTNNLLTREAIREADGSYRSCTEYGYDQKNRLIQARVDLSPDDNSTADGNVYATSYSYYDNSNLISTLTQGDGSQVVLTYTTVNGESRIASITDAVGCVTRFSYDTAARTTTVTDALGNQTRYTYNANNSLVKAVGPEVAGVSQQVMYEYDAAGNVISAANGVGYQINYTYDSVGNQLTQADNLGNRRERTYDAYHRMLTDTIYRVPGTGQQGPSAPEVTRYVYDEKGNLRFVVDAEGGVTESRFDAIGQLVTSLTYPQERYDMSALGADDALSLGEVQQWVAAQDARQAARIDYQYDMRGQMASSTTYGGLDVDGAGLRDGSESTTRYVYDVAGNLLLKVDPNNNQTSYVYDGLNRVLSSTNALGHVTTHQYDDVNHIVTHTQINGRIDTDIYDAAGQLLATVAGGVARTEYRYDALGHLVETTDATGVELQYLYDASGNLSAEIGADGQVTQYFYDGAGQRVQTIRRAVALAQAQMDALEIDPTLFSGMVRGSAADQISFALYDGAGRLSKKIDAAGFVTEFRYDGAGNLLATTEFANAVDTSGLTAASRPQDVRATVNADDRTTYYYYDDNNQRTGMIDGEGYVTEYRYDAAGRPTEMIRYAARVAGTPTAAVNFDALTPVASAADQHSYVLHDGEGQVTGTVDAEGYLTERSYDANGNLVQSVRYANRTGAPVAAGTTVDDLRPVASGADQVSTQSYDAMGRVISASNGEGTRTDFAYDASGNLVSTVAAAGTGQMRMVGQQYDSFGRLTAVLSPVGSALLQVAKTSAEAETIWNQYGTRYTYDAVGRRTSTTDANGNRSLYYYNRSGDLTHTINALGEVEERRFDALGEQVATVRYGSRLANLTGLNGGLVDATLIAALAGIADAGKDSVTTGTYNKAGELLTTTDALGGTTTFAYNAFGEQVGRTTSIDGSRALVQAAQYDKRGEVVSATTDGVITAREYDAFGRVVRSVDGNGNATVQTYDRLGRVVTVQDPTNALRQSSYDAFGRQLTQTDATGNTTTYAYDAASRSMTVRTAEGVSMAVVHDRHGQTQSVTDGNGNVTSYSYDADGNLVESGNALGRTNNEYDAGGRLVESTDANGNLVRYSYDAANRLLSRTVDPEGLALTTSYQYDAKGQQIAATDANGVVTTITYDLKGQVVEQVVDPDGLRLTTRFSYDQRGKMLTVTNPGGLVTQYVYDAQGRRTEEHVDPSGLNQTKRYGYDNNGNMVNSTDALGNVMRIAYDAGDRPVYVVDGAGNVKRVSYDDQGRVVATIAYAQPISLDGLAEQASAAEIAARVTVTAGQDAIEQRVYDKDGRVRYSLDGAGGVTVFSYDGNGNVTERTGYANRIDLAAWVPGTAPAVVADAVQDAHLRTVYDANNRAIYRIDGTGAVTETKYDGNGNVVDSIAYANRIATDTPATASAVAAALVADSTRDQHVRQRFDGADRMLESTDATGIEQQYLYDAMGRLLAQVDGGGRVTQYAYNAAGERVQTTRHALALTQAQMDALEADPSSFAAASDPADQVSFTLYDDAGRVARTADSGGFVTDYRYDAVRNLVATIRYATAADTRGLTAASRPQDVQVSPGAEDRSIYHYYNDNNQRIGTVDAEGYATEYRYDAAGRQTETVRYAAVTDGTAQVNSNFATLLPPSAAADEHSHALYDGQGRVIGTVDAEGYLTERSYDADGNMVRSVRYANRTGAAVTAAATLDDLRPVESAQDQVSTQAYDALGRMTGSTSAEGTRSEYRYDANGNLTAAVAAAGTAEARTTSQQFDAMGQLTEVQGSRKGVHYTYDAAGRRSSSTDANGNRTLYYYDRSGELTHTINALGEVEERRYDALGEQVATVRYGNRLGSVDGLNGGLADKALADALAGLADASKDTITSASYGKTGQLVAMTDALGGTTTFGYNAFGEQVGRTTSIDGGRALVQAAQYDKRGEVVAATTDGVVTAREYDAFGRVVHSVDGNGNATVHAYDRLGRVVTVQDPTNALRQSSYDAFGRQLTQTDATGNTTTYAYDAASRSMTVRTAEGVSMTVVHDRHGQTQSVTDGNGNVTSYSYDADGNLVESGNALGRTNNEYDAGGRLVESTDANGNLVRYSYDAANRLLSRTVDPEGLALTTSYQYDAKGQQIAASDANGVVTTITYDLKGQVVEQLVDPDGLRLTTRFSYDQRGKMLTVTNPGGLVTQYVYDAQGRRTEEHVDPSGLNQTRRYGYDNNGNMVNSTDALGNLSRYAYDANDRLVYTVDAAGNVRHNSYDAAGRMTASAAHAQPISLDGLAEAAPVAEIAARLIFTAGQDTLEQRVYDNDGRVRYNVDGTGAVTQFHYDGNGNVVETVAYANRIPMSTAATQEAVAAALVPDSVHDQQVRQTYDSANRLTWRANGVGAVTQFVYDGAGNQVKRIEYATPIDGSAEPQDVSTSAADRVTIMAYDSANRPVFQIDANGGVTRKVYDAAGNVTAFVAYATPIAAPAESGETPDLAQVEATLQTNGLQDRITRLTYDAAGRNVFAVDAEGNVSETRYDAEGRPTERVRYAQPLTLSNLPASVTTDEVRDLLTADSDHDRTTSQVYDAVGRVVYVVDAEGYVRHNQYDGAGRLLAVTQYAAPISAGTQTSLSSLVAALRPNAAADQVSTFRYDVLGHLVGSTDALGNAEQFSYDGFGNKLSFTDKNGATWNYEYDAAGRLIAEIAPQVAVTAVTTDANGNLVVDESASGNVRIETRIAYDAFGHVASRTEAANTPQARTTQYEYDALGRQTKVIHAPVAIYDAASDDLATNGANGLASRTEKTVQLFSETHYDNFGNVVATRDLGGNYAYQAYDKSGRLVFNVDTLGYVTGFEHNAFGETIATTRFAQSPLLSAAAAQAPGAQDIAVALETVGHADDRTVRVNYDRLGRPVQVTEPAVWVNNGQQGMLASKITRNFYNAFGELSQQAVLADAATNTWAVNSYYYDRDGQNTSTADALGYVTTRAFDAAGNVTRVTEYANASTPGQVELTLPADSTNDRTTVYAYDSANRLVSKTRLNVQFSDGTDDVGAQTRSFGDVTTTYAYDAVGNRTLTTDALGGRTFTAYDALGRITSVTGPAVAGIDGALETLTVYRRDALGNVVAKIEYARGASGTASDSDRVTVARYDSFGNLTQSTDAGGVSHFTSYDEGQRARKQWQSVTGSDGKAHTLFAAFEYDAAGRVIAKITPGSNVVFDTASKTIKTVDQSTVAAVRDELQYNAFGQVARELNSDGRETRHSYDNAGRLWRTSAGDGDTQVSLYNLQGDRTATLASAGMASRSLYGDVDPLVAAENAEQADKLQGLRRTEMVLDVLGRATILVLPARDGVRPVIHQSFDRWGNVVSRTTLSGIGSAIVYEFDANNRVVSKKEPDGAGEQSAASPVTEYYYDRLGRQIAVRDQNGNVNQQSWDAAGNLSRELHADGGTVDHFYNAFDEQVARRDAENHLTTVRRDDLGRVVETSSDLVGSYRLGANGTISGGLQHLVNTTRYDEAGRVVAQINGAGESTRYDVDLRGNATAIYQPLGQKAVSAYDSQGNLVAYSDANGALETWDYDANGRLQEHTDIGGATYAYVYDSAGQLIQQTNTRGQDTRTTYDGAGQKTQIRDMADGTTTQSTFNLAGQVTRELTVQNGLLYEDNVLAYDTLGRLARIDAVADRISVVMEYDKVGNMVRQSTVQQARQAGTLLQQVRIDGAYRTVARGLATLSSTVEDQWYAYDSMNRQVMIEGAVSGNADEQLNVTATQGHFVTYDKNGNRTSDTYQGSQLVAQIGADGRTQYVVREGRVTMHFRYDAAGRLSETAIGAVDSVGNSLSAAYATVVSRNYYDAAGRLIRSGASSETPQAYVQAALANPDKSYGTNLTLTSYDANGRLLSERITKLSGESIRDTSYTGGYDAAGNVLSYVVSDRNGVATTKVSRIMLDGYKRTSTTTTKVAPNGIAAVTSSAYAYEVGGDLAGITTTSALGQISTRTQHYDLAGNVLQTKEGNIVTNRLVVDGRTYAVWQGAVTPPSTLAIASSRTMSAAAAGGVSQLTISAGADIAGLTSLYRELLKREPDSDGLNFWASAMDSGMTLDEVRDAIMASDEYKQLQEPSGPTPDEIRTEEVTVVFGLLLGRMPDQAGLDYWKSALESGMSLNDVASIIMSSPEYINRQTKRPELGNFDHTDYVIVQRIPGDTLERLAQLAYNSPNLSYLIANANGVTSNAELDKLDAIIIPDNLIHSDNGQALIVENPRTGNVTIDYYIPMASLLDPPEFPEFDSPRMIGSGSRIRTVETLEDGTIREFITYLDSKNVPRWVLGTGTSAKPDLGTGTGSPWENDGNQPAVGGDQTGSSSIQDRALDIGQTEGMQQVYIRGDRPKYERFALSGTQQAYVRPNASAPAVPPLPQPNPGNSDPKLQYTSQKVILKGDGSFDYETSIASIDSGSGLPQVKRHTRIAPTSDAVKSFIHGVLNGAASAVTEPFKQVLDLGQIGLGIFTNGRYEPTWYSGVGQAYENGAAKDEIFLRAVLESNAVTGLGITIYDIAELVKKEDWNGVAGSLGNAIGGMITSKVATKAGDTTGSKVGGWEPQGIKERVADLDVGRQMVDAMVKGSASSKNPMSREVAEAIVNGQLKSGSTVPVARSLNEGDKLLKIVPAGAKPTDHTAFWADPDIIQAELKSPGTIAERFGLPPETSKADTYNIWQITAKGPTTVFDSIVAETFDPSTGKRIQSGGAHQSITENRDEFSEAIIVGQIVVNSGPGPGG